MATKEAKIENLGNTKNLDEQVVTEATTAAHRVECMVQAIDLIGQAFDLSRPKIVARDCDSNDLPEQLNIVRKHQRWAINSIMRMFDKAIPMTKDSLKSQRKRTMDLQHGRSRGVVDDFAINQSLDWEDRYEETLLVLKQLQKAADEGYEVVFGEAYGDVAEDVAVKIPSIAQTLSDETRARLAARTK